MFSAPSRKIRPEFPRYLRSFDGDKGPVETKKKYACILLTN